MSSNTGSRPPVGYHAGMTGGDDERTIVEGVVIPQRKLSVLGGVVGLGFVALVFTVVGFSMGSDTPSMKVVALCCGGAAGLIFAAAPLLVLWFRARYRVIVGTDGIAFLELRDGSARRSFQFPLRYTRSWHREIIASQRGTILHPVLIIAIQDEKGECVLALRQDRGALQHPPQKWEEREFSIDRAVTYGSAGVLGFGLAPGGDLEALERHFSELNQPRPSGAD